MVYGLRVTVAAIAICFGGMHQPRVDSHSLRIPVLTFKLAQTNVDRYLSELQPTSVSEKYRNK